MISDGKVTPSDYDIEKAVLGELMLSRTAIDATMDILKPDTFYHEANTLVFRAVMSLYNQNLPCDIMSVTSELKKRGALERAGGAYYVTTLTNKPSGYNIEHHSLLLTQLYIKRQLIYISSEIYNTAYYDENDALELMDQAEKKIQAVRDGFEGAKKSATFPAHIKAEIQWKKDAIKNGISINGLNTGNTSLDKAIGGFQKTDFIVLAARPGMGKTTRALNFAKAVALQNQPVAIFSLEMSAQQLVRKFIIEQSNIFGHKYIENRLNEYDLQAIDRAADELMKLPIEIYDNSTLNPLQMKAKLRKFVKSFGSVGLVVLDYLQLMRYQERTQSTEQEVSNISRSLKEIAKEFDVPVLALSQLSREVEGRPGTKRPRLSDLRHSGSIEQDSDLVMFLYRPSYYFPYGERKGPEKDANYTIDKIIESKYNQVSELIIEKFRGGKPNRAIIEYFDGGYSRFKEKPEEASMLTDIGAMVDETDDMPF